MTARIVEMANHELQLLISLHDGVNLETLDRCLLSSVKAWGGYNGEQLVCAWGLIPPTFLSDNAYLWLWTTDDLSGLEFKFIRHSQRAVQDMLEEYPLIHGVTDPNNEPSKRWLKWLGARFSEPVNGWLPFQIRKEHGLRRTGT